MYLDISHHNTTRLENRFPTVAAACRTHGLNLSQDPIPCVPAAHYQCGGISVDLAGQTSVPQLYATGEVACTGLHGANRLASTSLLEGLVWGTSIADDFIHKVVSNTHQASMGCLSDVAESRILTRATIKEKRKLAIQWQSLRTLMWESVGPIRSYSGLECAVQTLTKLGETRNGTCSYESLAWENAVVTALELARAAAQESECVGTHFLVSGKSNDDEVVERVHQLIGSTKNRRTTRMGV